MPSIQHSIAKWEGRRLRVGWVRACLSPAVRFVKRTAAEDGESFTFTDYAFLRALGEKGEKADKIGVACGGLSTVKLRVAARAAGPKLFVNGVETKARAAGGFLVLEGM